MPVLHDPLRGQIQHPAQGIVIGKRWLVFRDLPKLAVQPLDNVRRAYDLTDLQRIFKERTQNFPAFLPAFDTGRILLSPLFPELEEVFFRLIQGHGSIDFLQISHHLLDVFPADEAGGGTNLMDDAPLQTALGDIISAVLVKC